MHQEPDAPPDPRNGLEPKVELEPLIAEIWRRVLNLEHLAIGGDHNFFDLGGHSLAMTKVHTELLAALKGKVERCEVTLVELFEYPTIGSLARHLIGIGQGNNGVEAVQARARKQRVAAQRRPQPRRRVLDE